MLHPASIKQTSLDHETSQGSIEAQTQSPSHSISISKTIRHQPSVTSIYKQASSTLSTSIATTITLAPTASKLPNLPTLPSKPALTGPTNHPASIMPAPTPYPSRCSTPEAPQTAQKPVSQTGQKPAGWTEAMMKVLKQQLSNGEDAKSAIILVETEFPCMRDRIPVCFVERVRKG